MSDDRIDKLESKIDKVLDIAQDQAVTLGRLTVSVEEHVRRSNLHEEEIKEIKQDVEPLKASVNRIMGGWKLFIYVVIPLLAAVITTLHFMK
jgi:hypothetical protein